MDEKKTAFTREKLADAIQIWNRAAISLLDIRHNLISPEEALRGYRLPSSAFLYTNGKVEVSLDDTVYPLLPIRIIPRREGNGINAVTLRKLAGILYRALQNWGTSISKTGVCQAAGANQSFPATVQLCTPKSTAFCGSAEKDV